MIGEIGGDAEERAAAYIKEHVTKPVVGYVAGFTAPRARRWATPAPSCPARPAPPRRRREALEAAGVKVGKTPSETAQLMREIMEQLTRYGRQSSTLTMAAATPRRDIRGAAVNWPRSAWVLAPGRAPLVTMKAPDPSRRLRSESAVPELAARHRHRGRPVRGDPLWGRSPQSARGPSSSCPPSSAGSRRPERQPRLVLGGAGRHGDLVPRPRPVDRRQRGDRSR